MAEVPSRTIVRANALQAATLFASDDAARNYLRGAFIDSLPEGAAILASDGHALVAHCDDGALVEGVPKIWRTPDKELRALIKAASPLVGAEVVWTVLTRYQVSIVVAEGPAQVLDGTARVVGSITGDFIVDTSFVDWRRTLQTHRVLEPGDALPTINAKFLERCDKFARTLDPGSRFGTGLLLRASAGKAVRVALQGHRNTAILVMGMGGPDYSEPEWLTPSDSRLDEAA